MKDESGVDSGYRNVGRFFLFAIPLILGVAASVWLGVYIGAHDFRKELSQEDRAAQYVGAESRPKNKLKIELPQRGCIRITKADVDGQRLLFYAKNECGVDYSYVELHWQLRSPTGVILFENYTNHSYRFAFSDDHCGVPEAKDSEVECRVEIVADDRASSVAIWGSTR